MQRAKRLSLFFGGILSTIALLAAPLAAPAAAASSASVNFENPVYTTGNINGQDGWMKTGGYDAVINANTPVTSSFEGQSLRLSDAVTSGSFGDQTFAKPLTDAVGEVNSTDGTFSRGNLQRHFEMKFDIASTMLSEQAGMHVSVSPDRGDGSRMSYLRFDDMPGGVHVYFDDVEGTTPFDGIVDGIGCDTPVCANFVETDIATLGRAKAHTIKLAMDTLDGPSNDIVRVWIDGNLEVTGTSWEDYYRFDNESAAEQSPRIVKTILFRESGDAHPANLGKGFLFDNLSFSSSMKVGAPTDKDQCKNNGWKVFNDPSFRNQGDCVSYVERHDHDGDHDNHGHHGHSNHHRKNHHGLDD